MKRLQQTIWAVSYTHLDVYKRQALDNPERLEKILRSIKSRYGVYACYGNHDIQEKILAGFTFPRKGKKMSDPRMDTFLEKSNIHLLRDEAVEIDNAFYQMCIRDRLLDIVDDAFDAVAEKYNVKIKGFFSECFGMMDEGRCV